MPVYVGYGSTLTVDKCTVNDSYSVPRLSRGGGRGGGGAASATSYKHDHETYTTNTRHLVVATAANASDPHALSLPATMLR